MSNPASRLYGPCLAFYRKFVKPIPWFHAVFYALGSAFLAVLERVMGFRTNHGDPLFWRVALITGSHEAGTRELFARIIRPGMTVVDVGAHIGYYTTQFSRLVGDSGRVIAFEPHPRNYEILRRNVARRKNVTLLQNAASDRDETVTLFDDMPDTGGPSLRRDDDRADQVKTLSSAHELAPRAVAQATGSRFDVAAVRIDDALAALGIDSVDVVKMDIEGAETGAMLGARDVLQNSAAVDIVFELYPAAMKPFGVDPLTPCSWLRELGFELSRIADDGEPARLADETATRGLVEQLERSGSEANILARRRMG